MALNKEDLHLHPHLQESMLLPSLESPLFRNMSQQDLNTPATTPPLPEIWLVVLSHVLHITAADANTGITITEVISAVRGFWLSDVPWTWEGYAACRRRAKKDLLKREGKEKAAEAEALGEQWKFTWWDSLEPVRKVEKVEKAFEDEVAVTLGRWEAPKVDAEGNVRLVLGGLQT